MSKEFHNNHVKCLNRFYSLKKTSRGSEIESSKCLYHLRLVLLTLVYESKEKEKSAMGSKKSE